MCTLVCVFTLIKWPHDKMTLSHRYGARTYVFLHSKQGSSVAPGQNFKYTACAKHVCIKKHPKVKQHAQQSTHNACTQGEK